MDYDVVNAVGWKGTGSQTIQELDDAYLLIEHRKSKETGESYPVEHLVSKAHVNCLLRLLLTKCDPGVDYKYTYLVRMLLEHYKFHELEGLPLDFMLTAFNGGRFRQKYYFKYLHYPLKVLESKGHITYFGRGGVQLNWGSTNPNVTLIYHTQTGTKGFS